ncbi:MAG TPA: hypothetical protein VFE10_05410 [Phenylobacterium sp.]|nr:hypothetical protein [Phenylobacterium sp.]
MQGGIEHDVAPAHHILRDARARQVERASVAGPPSLGRLVLGVQRAHPSGQTGRADHDLIADADRARQHRAGDHDAHALKGEGAVHGQAKPGLSGPLRQGRRRRGQMIAQSVETLPGHCGHRQGVGRLQHGSRDDRSQFGGDLVKALGRRQIGFAQDHQPLSDAQQVDDRQMLQRLRLDPLVSGDHQ